MNNYELLKFQTLKVRERIAGLARANAAQADVIPPGWNNNIRWHIGHLVVTPHRLTSLIIGEPLSVPEEYNAWFAKDTSPRNWGSAPVPPLEQLISEMTTGMDGIFKKMEGRLDTPYPTPYATSVGITLHNPAESLLMSYMHDGIHVGLLLALARALKG